MNNLELSKGQSPAIKSLAGKKEPLPRNTVQVATGSALGERWFTLKSEINILGVKS